MSSNNTVDSSTWCISWRVRNALAINTGCARSTQNKSTVTEIVRDTLPINTVGSNKTWNSSTWSIASISFFWDAFSISANSISRAQHSSTLINCIQNTLTFNAMSSSQAWNSSTWVFTWIILWVIIWARHTLTIFANGVEATSNPRAEVFRAQPTPSIDASMVRSTSNSSAGINLIGNTVSLFTPVSEHTFSVSTRVDVSLCFDSG